MIDMYEAMFSRSLATQSYLLVSGALGDGSFARTRGAFEQQGLAPVLLDFDGDARGKSPTEIRSFFEQAWTDRSPVLACGVERLDSLGVKEIISCMEETAARGVAAALVIKSSCEGMDLGKAVLLVEMPLPDPIKISSALANRRGSVDGRRAQEEQAKPALK